MDNAKTLEANLDDFKKITIELIYIGEVVSDENQIVILLNALLESFDWIRAAIEYGKEDITLGVVVAALRSKELDLKFNNKIMFSNVNGDALTVKERSERKKSKNNRSYSRSKSRGKK